MNDTAYTQRGMTIPPHMLTRLRAYIEQGHPVGDFLQAVLSNDLREACGRADETNIRILPVYVIYLYNEAPAACWGSPAKHQAWLQKFAAEREKSARSTS
jgi:hypothetical protein